MEKYQLSRNSTTDKKVLFDFISKTVQEQSKGLKNYNISLIDRELGVPDVQEFDFHISVTWKEKKIGHLRLEIRHNATITLSLCFSSEFSDVFHYGSVLPKRISVKSPIVFSRKSCPENLFVELDSWKNTIIQDIKKIKKFI